MSGKDVYKQAVISMLDAAKKALEKAGLTIDDIACVIPHQANVRIIEAIADRLKIPLEQVFRESRPLRQHLRRRRRHRAR